MIHAFLLIGQSNAAGRGFLNESAPLDTCGGKLLVARNGLWLKMFRPVNPDRSFSGSCFAETFAKAYSECHPDVQVGIIPCADGGTCISQWQPGEILFDNAVNCARLAMRSAQLVGVLWHQGEADCRPERYPFYLDRLKNMIAALRQELGVPDLPFLLGGLGDYLKDNPRDYLINYPAVNAALRLAAAENEHIAFVSAAGLSSNPDHLHFSAAALNEFGLRYHEAFKTLPAYNQTFSVSANDEAAARTDMELL